MIQITIHLLLLSLLLPVPVDTSRPGTFTVRYQADSDLAGNNDDNVIIVTVVVSCPTGQIFDGAMCVPCPTGQIFNGTACVAFVATHVLSFNGTGGNGFSLPIGITTTDNNIFIVDTLNHRVQVYDINGNYVSQFGSEGSANGQFRVPVGITTNGTHIFVADNGNHRIQNL